MSAGNWGVDSTGGVPKVKGKRGRKPATPEQKRIMAEKNRSYLMTHPWLARNYAPTPEKIEKRKKRDKQREAAKEELRKTRERRAIEKYKAGLSRRWPNYLNSGLSRAVYERTWGRWRVAFEEWVQVITRKIPVRRKLRLWGGPRYCRDVDGYSVGLRVLDIAASAGNPLSFSMLVARAVAPENNPAGLRWPNVRHGIKTLLRKEYLAWVDVPPRPGRSSRALVITPLGRKLLWLLV